MATECIPDFLDFHPVEGRKGVAATASNMTRGSDLPSMIYVITSIARAYRGITLWFTAISLSLEAQPKNGCHVLKGP